MDWFDPIDTPLFCEFIRQWPTLTPVKRTRKNTLETFFHQRNLRFPQVLEDRLAAIKTAMALTLDEAIIIPYHLQTQVLIEQLSVTLEGIKQFDQEIEKIACQHADYALFSALPGAGPSLAPRLLVAFGEQRTRYPSAADLQKYAGVAPVTERSGKKHWGIGGGSARPFFDKPSPSGRRRPSINRSGQANTSDSNAQKAQPIKPLCLPWRLNGYVSSTGAGRQVNLMMNQLT